ISGQPPTTATTRYRLAGRCDWPAKRLTATKHTLHPGARPSDAIPDLTQRKYVRAWSPRAAKTLEPDTTERFPPAGRNEYQLPPRWWDRPRRGRRNRRRGPRSDRRKPGRLKPVRPDRARD